MINIDFKPSFSMISKH